MTGYELIAILVPCVVTSGTTIYLARLTKETRAKVDENTAVTKQTAEVVTDTGKKVNGRMEELARAIADKNMAEGVLEGRKQKGQEQRDAVLDAASAAATVKLAEADATAKVEAEKQENAG